MWEGKALPHERMIAMMDTHLPPIHPVLREVALPLPLTEDASWTLAQTTEPGRCREQLRITLSACGDLIVEINGKEIATSRYVFDGAGKLVSLHQLGDGVEPLFQTLRTHVLSKIRDCCAPPALCS